MRQKFTIAWVTFSDPTSPRARLFLQDPLLPSRLILVLLIHAAAHKQIARRSSYPAIKRDGRFRAHCPDNGHASVLTACGRP